MEYQSADRAPNWELGVWPQTRQCWEAEGLDPTLCHWDWFAGEAALGMDPREFIRFRAEPMPPFDVETLSEDERTLTFRDEWGRIRKALKEGSVRGGRMSMDTYIGFPVTDTTSWRAMKSRLQVCAERFEPNWQTTRLAGWRERDFPLIFGPNCTTLGFYWFARDLLGTEGLSFAFYDQPALVHDIMEHHANFLIEAMRPILQHATVDYVCLNEDLAMKSGPLLSPTTYRTFIFPRLRRLVDFLKAQGVTYVAIDTDGNPELLVPMFMEAGVDILWPMERAAEQDPVRLRAKFGRALRLWGGVDKRVLAYGPQAIDEHLRALQPLVEQGGFIPTIDHTVPPDISWANFQHYLASKTKLLQGTL
jgi:uroporphyrinogen decarboxylase